MSLSASPNPQACVRIAMWSGPRNISTALMRSWEARGDAAVCDEPLYAHYLEHTGLDHPGAAEVMEHHETDWRAVVRWLSGPAPDGRSIFYQKHMAHHLLPHIDLDWLDGIESCFLVRDPGQMLVSLAKVIPAPTVEQTGLPQQVRLFDHLTARTGREPPVVDARDVLLDPPGVLGRLCKRLGVRYTDAMLSWPPGRRSTDGIWARHWYAAVEQSTGFASYQPREIDLPDHLAPVLAACTPLYYKLCAHRI